MKIAVVICWFGEWPWYFPYFLHSCKYNPTIDFLIISANKVTINNVPGNVQFINKPIKDLEKEFTNEMSFKVNLDSTYKLCDFKPAYGLLFQKILAGYDFWGVADLDLILGNLRCFLTDDFLNRYDFISMRHDYTTGCFALYRNTDQMRKLFMTSKDYQTVLYSPEHYCFDECNFCWDELTAGKSIFEFDTEIESFTHVVKAAQSKGAIRAHFDFILMEGHPGRIIFDNGRIIYKRQFEAIMYHLFWLKKFYNPRQKSISIPDKYFISPTRIYHKRTPKSKTLPLNKN